MSVELNLASGATAKINVAPFEDVMSLKNAIEKALIESGSAMKLEGTMTNMALLLFAVDSSPAFNTALFKCLERSLYDEEKITKRTFEPEKARGDYYEIVIECLKVNIRPFLKGLTSRLSSLKEMMSLKESPASKSET